MLLVTGATGNVGAEVAAALLRQGAPVRALVRDVAGSAARLPAGAVPVAGDLNDAQTLDDALAGARGLFLLPGYAGTADALAAARAAGVERVVLLSGRSAASGDTGNAITRYMMESEATVRAAGIPWTIVRPSGFMSNTLQWRDQLAAGDVVRAPFGDVAVAMIDPADIGAVVAAALTADGHAGAVHELSGPQPLRPADRVRVLGGALGRELRFEGMSDEEARADLEAAMPREYVDAFFDFYVAGSLDESPVLPTVERLLGRPPRTFAQWAQTHAAAFAASA